MLAAAADPRSTTICAFLANSSPSAYMYLFDDNPILTYKSNPNGMNDIDMCNKTHTICREGNLYLNYITCQPLLADYIQITPC